MKHDEAELHLKFCKEIKKLYPEDDFIRHEREGKRSLFMQSLFKVYNQGIDKLPDFEGLITNLTYNGFYIEFKKPGEKWLLKDGLTVKPVYANQYRTHLLLRSMGRAVWFCNDLLAAVLLYSKFKDNQTYPMQDYQLPYSDMDRAEEQAKSFFGY